jgi:single-stranded-DNA-specific exonuclease
LPSAAKTWHLLPHDPAAIERLATTLRLSPVVAQLLLNRDLRDPEAARRFLAAPLTQLHEPALLPGVTEAAERLHTAVCHGQRVCVYGDYDVDGVTGTAILVQALRLLGGQVEFYVPNRMEEGYGLNREALRKIAQADGGEPTSPDVDFYREVSWRRASPSAVSVVITVDCGISSLAEADEARRLGLDLIITDHHEFKDRLPAANTLVHPRLPGGSYPFGGLSGSAVAFKVAWALCQRHCGSPRVEPRLKEFLLDSMALSALGTVADVVPLHDENRIFVRHGLARLRQAPSVGLKALLESAGLDGKSDLCAADVAFFLAPRLNAVGRLGCARLAIELLLTPSRQRAVDLARYLEDQNDKRKKIERHILGHAREMVEADGLDGSPALVLASPDWHPGLIGIVAGRLAEMYARPVLLVVHRGPDAPGFGSGRSVPGFRLHEALAACGEGLLSHGGHAAAAGFKIGPGALDGFRERFCAYAARHFAAAPPAPRLVIDAEVPLSALTPGLLEAVAQLEPYGAGNPQPLFLAGGLQVVGEPRRIGGGERHLSFRVRQEGRELRVIAFNMADRAEELMSADGRCCLVFTPRINEWQGRRTVELELRDLQPGPVARFG